MAEHPGDDHGAAVATPNPAIPGPELVPANATATRRQHGSVVGPPNVGGKGAGGRHPVIAPPLNKPIAAPLDSAGDPALLNGAQPGQDPAPKSDQGHKHHGHHHPTAAVQHAAGKASRRHHRAERAK
ncbi:MAG TPA: hypothetical protein VFQ80_10730 [Thermomicrobiales bacterium]|jgi:hypothetical protein|nr:hypothetical protein [Thermomicrobiales bacterium]